MNPSIDRIAAVARFEVRRLLRARSTLVGLACFVVILAAGHWSYWAAMPPRATDDRLFGYAYIAAMIASLRLGLAADRELGLDGFLVSNFVSPMQYVAGKAVAAIVHLAGFGVFAFVAALALSAGEFEYALWYPLLFTLVAGMFLPAILLVELAVDTRHPAAFVLVGFTVALAGAEALSDVMVVVGALGLDMQRFAFDSLAPLAVRAAAAPLLLLLLYPLCRMRLAGFARWIRAPG